MGKSYCKMISYITPTLWQRPKFILEAEKSLLNQTYKNIEWIIVSDTDSPENIKLKNSVPTRVIIDKSLNNVSKARNKGIIHSYGEYIAFLDDDDAKHPTFGEEMLSAIVPPFICSVSSMDVINENSEIIGKHLYCPNTYEGIWDSTALYFANEILIPKNLFNEIGMFDENMATSEDYEFFIRLFKKGRLNNLCKNLSYYRKHKDNLSANSEIQGEPTHRSIHYMHEKHGMGFYCNRCNKDSRIISNYYEK